MKVCKNCQTQLEDDTLFCTTCGAQIQTQTQQPQQEEQKEASSGNAATYADSFDHTEEFDAKDISDNKVISMLVYLMGAVGILIALLASNTSKYAGFHVRQALKITVLELLIGIIMAVSLVIGIIPFLGWAIIILIWIASAVSMGILLVVKIICFFQICAGKAIEAPIVRNFTFLK